jgi:hypothetical protein
MLPPFGKKLLNYICIFLLFYWGFVYAQIYYIIRKYFAIGDFIDILNSVNDFDKFASTILYCFMEVLLLTPDIFFYSLIMAFFITLLLCIIVELFFNK